MNTTIQNQLETVTKNLSLARAFAEKYPLAVASEGSFFCAFDYELRFRIVDAALAGEVFGKEGWVREREKYSTKITYNWIRDIDNIHVKIESAEVVNDMDFVPVPPKAFPIALQEASV